MTQFNSSTPSTPSASMMSNFILWEDLKRRYGERKYGARQSTSRTPVSITVNHYRYGTRLHHSTVWIWYTPADVKRGTPARYAVNSDDVRRIKQTYPTICTDIYTTRRNGQPFVV